MQIRSDDGSYAVVRNYPTPGQNMLPTPPRSLDPPAGHQSRTAQKQCRIFRQQWEYVVEQCRARAIVGAEHEVVSGLNQGDSLVQAKINSTVRFAEKAGEAINLVLKVLACSIGRRGVDDDPVEAGSIEAIERANIVIDDADAISRRGHDSKQRLGTPVACVAACVLEDRRRHQERLRKACRPIRRPRTPSSGIGPARQRRRFEHSIARTECRRSCQGALREAGVEGSRVWLYQNSQAMVSSLACRRPIAS